MLQSLLELPLQGPMKKLKKVAIIKDTTAAVKPPCTVILKTAHVDISPWKSALHAIMGTLAKSAECVTHS